MTLIKIDKPYSREQIAADFDVEFPLSQWVLAQLSGDEEYESNRYDIEKKDEQGNTWSLFLYMDEHSSHVIAIDDIASKNDSSRNCADVHRSPFASLFTTLVQMTDEYLSKQHYTKGQHLLLKKRHSFEVTNSQEKTYEANDKIVIWMVSEAFGDGYFQYIFYFVKDRPDRRKKPPILHVLNQRQLNDLFYT